jgi:hypothetical protein
MKMSLALHPRRPLTRSEAKGCLAANLAMPGTGSLVAGRPSGYFQLALAALGFFVSLIGGVRCLLWCAANWTRITEPPLDDPFANFLLIWQAIRWPLAGLGIFLFAMVWALFTSLQILHSARPGAQAPPPASQASQSQP